MTKDTYGAVLGWASLTFLFIMLICSFVVSFQIIDLLYAIALIIFAVFYKRMKWLYDDWHSLSSF